MTGPILFPGRLPQGALLGGSPTPAAPAPAAPAPQPVTHPAPLWLDKDHGLSSPRATHWDARLPAGSRAEAIADNETGTALAASGALAFAARQNGGFLLARAIPDAARCTLAAIAAPVAGQPGGTILSLRPLDGSGYLFLSLEDGTARIGRKDSDLALSLPVPDGVALLTLALDHGGVTLCVNGGTAQTARTPIEGPADLYIGCRDGRGGLKNKLGAFRLSDVLVWPDDPAPDTTQAQTLWRERLRHGI